jgi:hypothetical protein
MADKAAAIIKMLKDAQTQALWSCTYALSETCGDTHSGAIDMAKIAKAAYWSGAAREIQKVLLKHG